MTWFSQIGSMRRYILIVAIAAILVAAGAAAAYRALPGLISEDKLRSAIAAHAATWSGGELRLPEDAAVSVARGPMMTVENAEFGGTFGGATWQLEVASLQATFRMLPLLQGQVEIETLTLDTPHLSVRDRDEPATADPGAPPARHPDLPGPEGEVIVTNASFAYEGPTGRQVGFDGMDLRIAAEPDSTAVLLTGALPAGNGRLHVQGRLADPAESFSGRGSDARLVLRGAATADDAGTPPPQPQAEVPGAAQESRVISELRQMAAAVGLAGTGPIAIEGRFSATPRTVAVDDATLSFGGFLADGDLSIALAGEGPPADQVDGVVRGAVAAWRDAAAAIEAGAWREAPVSLGWLAPLEITLAARLRESRLAGSNLEARRIRLQASDGRARLEIVAAGDLGRLQGELTLDAGPADGPARIAVNGRLGDVDIGATARTMLSLAPPPLVSPPPVPEGTLDAEIDLASRGETLGGMATAIDGTVSAEARDGSLAGADLILTLQGLEGGREIMTEEDGPLIPAGGRTAFDTLEGRIDFLPGFARLSEFRIRGDRYEIDMSGEADLRIGAMRAEGQAKLHGEDTDDGDPSPVVDLPFGFGGTLAAPVVAPGVPRSRGNLASEAAAEGDVE